MPNSIIINNDVFQRQDVLIQRENTDDEIYFVAALPYHQWIHDNTPLAFFFLLQQRMKRRMIQSIISVT